MLRSQLEMVPVPEEAGKLRRQQTEELLPGRRLSLLNGSQQRIQSGAVANAKPFAAPIQKFAVPFDQFDACQTQGQSPRSFKLWLR